jgi:hypothetical protein
MSNMVLRSVPEKKLSAKRRTRFSLRNVIAVTITLFLVSLTFTAGLGVSGTPSGSATFANAEGCSIPGMDPNGSGMGLLGTDFAATGPTYPMTGSWPGGLGTLSPSSAIAGDITSPVNVAVANVDTNRLTAYEWYGAAGMSFYSGTWFPGSGCSIWVDGNNIFSSTIQGNTSNIGEILLTVVAWALNAHIIQDLITGDDAIITKIIAGFQNNLYLNWFLPLVILAAAAIGYMGLVKRRATDAAQGTIWVIVSATAAAVFFVFPTQIASWVDQTVIDVGNEISQAAVGLTSLGASADNVEESLCYIVPLSAESSLQSVPPGAREAAKVEAAERSRTADSDRTFRMTQCSLWETFIYRPWAAAQFGSLSVDTDLRVPAEAGATFRGNTTLPIVFLDITVQNRSEVVIGEGPDSDRRDTQWKEFRKVMIEDPAAAIGHANFSGNPAQARTGPVLVGAFALLFGLGPLVFLSATLIAQQIIMLLLLLLAPIALLVGIFPGRGRKIMLGWVEIFLSTVVKRLIAYVLIAVLLASMSAVIASDTSGDNYLIQVALVIAIGFGILNIRKIVIERFGTVSLGGDGGSFIKENLQAVKQGNQQTKGITTGSISGYANARGEGKGQLNSIRSAVSGARTGAKTGGPSFSEVGQSVKNAAPKARKERTEATVLDAGAKERLKNESNIDRQNANNLNQNLSQMNWRAEVESQGKKVAPSKMPIHGPDPKPKNWDEGIRSDILKGAQSSGVPVRPTIEANKSDSDDVSTGIANETELNEHLESLKLEKIPPLDIKIKGYEDTLFSLDIEIQKGTISDGARLQRDIINQELMNSRESRALFESELRNTEAALLKLSKTDTPPNGE